MTMTAVITSGSTVAITSVKGSNAEVSSDCAARRLHPDGRKGTTRCSR